MTAFTYRILDLDNAIADDSGRIPLIDWRKTGNERYEAYHAACGTDPFVNRHLTRSTTGEINLILTGRPTTVAVDTTDWLRRNSVPYAHLLMRNKSDSRPSALVKQTHLRWLVDYYDIKLDQITSAFDDHPEIIAMYKHHGIPATQVKAHDLDAYLNPLTKEPAL